MAISAEPVLKYNEAISSLIPCDTQEEIDFYWESFSPIRRRSSAAGSRISGVYRGKCGREPRAEMMEKGTPEQVARVTKATLAMKKFDIAALEKAYKR